MGESCSIIEVEDVVSSKREFLSFFWDLSESEVGPRVEASEAIRERLQMAKAQEKKTSSSSSDPLFVLETTSVKMDATFFNKDRIIQATSTFLRGLSYTLKRLLRGLKSSRGGSRQGFSLCLIEILQTFHTDLDIPAVVRKIIEYTSTSEEDAASSSQNKKKERVVKRRNIRGFRRRELVFGRLFGFCAVVRSHILSVYPEVCSTLIREILAIYQSKPWIREFCAEIMCDIVDDPKMTPQILNTYVFPSLAPWFLRDTQERKEEEDDTRDDDEGEEKKEVLGDVLSTDKETTTAAATTTSSAAGVTTTSPAMVYEPEVLSLAIAIWSKCNNDQHSNSSSNDDDEQQDVTASLHQRVRYIVVGDDNKLKKKKKKKNSTSGRGAPFAAKWMHALKRSDRVCPRIHSVWKRLFQRANLNVCDDESDDNNVDAVSSSSYDTDFLSAVWSTVVDGDQGLLRSGKRERKFLALRLCAALVPQLEAQHAHLILTPQLVNCIRTHASKPSKYLHKASNRVLDVIREQDPEFRVAVAAVLLAGGHVAEDAVAGGRGRGGSGVTDANDGASSSSKGTNQKGADSALLQRVVDGLEPTHMERYLECLLGNLRSDFVENTDDTATSQKEKKKGKKKKKTKTTGRTSETRGDDHAAAANDRRLRVRWTVRAMYSVGLALIRSSTANVTNDSPSSAVGDVESATRSMRKIVDVLYDIAIRRRRLIGDTEIEANIQDEEEEDSVPVECADCVLGLLTELGARSFGMSRESTERFDVESFCLQTASRLLELHSLSSRNASGDENAGDALSASIRTELDRLARSKANKSASASNEDRSHQQQQQNNQRRRVEAGVVDIKVFRTANGLLLSLLGLQRSCALSTFASEGEDKRNGGETGLDGVLSDLMQSSRAVASSASSSSTTTTTTTENDDKDEAVSVYMDVLLGLLMQPTRKMSAMRSIVNQGFRAICPCLKRAHLVDLLSIISEVDPKRLTSAGAGIAEDEDEDEEEEEEEEEESAESSQDDDDDDDDDEALSSDSDVDPLEAAQDAAIANIIRLRQEKQRNKKRAQNLNRLGRLFQLRVLDLVERFVHYATNNANPLVGTLPANILAAYREAALASMRTSNRKAKAAGGLGAIVDLRDRIRSIYSKRMCKRKCAASIATAEVLCEQIEDLVALAMTTSNQKISDMDELVTSGLLFVLRLSATTLPPGILDRVVDEVVATKRPKINANVLTQLVQRQSNKVGWTLVPRLAAYASGPATYTKESEVPIPRTSFQRSLCFHLLATILKSTSPSPANATSLRFCATSIADAFTNVWSQITDVEKKKVATASSSSSGATTTSTRAIDTSLRKKAQFQSVVQFGSAYCTYVERAYGLGAKGSVSAAKKRKMRKKKLKKRRREGQDGGAENDNDSSTSRSLEPTVERSLRRIRTSIETTIKELCDTNDIPTSIGKSASSLAATIERILDESNVAKETAAASTSVGTPATKRSRVISGAIPSSKKKKKKKKKKRAHADDSDINGCHSTRAKRPASSKKKKHG
eukprot:g3925.t1